MSTICSPSSQPNSSQISLILQGCAHAQIQRWEMKNNIRIMYTNNPKYTLLNTIKIQSIEFYKKQSQCTETYEMKAQRKWP